MRDLSGVEQQLMTAILAAGGQAESLLRITMEQGIAYSHAWRCAKRMELRGDICIQRHRLGRSYQLSLCCRCKLLPYSCNHTDSISMPADDARAGGVGVSAHPQRQTASDKLDLEVLLDF